MSTINKFIRIHTRIKLILLNLKDRFLFCRKHIFVSYVKSCIYIASNLIAYITPKQLPLIKYYEGIFSILLLQTIDDKYLSRSHTQTMVCSHKRKSLLYNSHRCPDPHALLFCHYSSCCYIITIRIGCKY